MPSKIAGGLFLILCLPLLIGGLWFSLVQYSIKRELKKQLEQQLPDEALVLIKIPLSRVQNPDGDFYFVKKDEFRYLGQLYDVVRQSTRQDTVFFYVIHDAAETQLFNSLKKHLGELLAQTPLHTHTRVQLLQLFKSVYCQAVRQIKSPPCPFYRLERVFSFVFYEKSLFLEIPHPPPQGLV